MKAQLSTWQWAAVAAATIFGTQAYAADPMKVDVSFRVTPASSTADFQTTVTIVYPEGVTLAQVDGALHNARMLADMSSIVDKVDILSPNASGAYVVKTRAAQDFAGMTFHKTTVTTCQDTRTEGRMVQTCTLNTGSGDTGEFFASGGSRNTCSVSGERVVCAHQAWGRVKDFSAGWGLVSRKSTRLAIGGGSQLIADLSTLALMLDGQSASSALSSVEGTDAWRVKQDLYDQGRAYTEGGQLPSGKTMLITGSNSTGAIRVSQE